AALCRHTGSSHRCCTEIDDGRARMQDAVAALDVLQFEQRARAVAGLAGALHEDVALVFLQPALARFGTFRHALESDRETEEAPARPGSRPRARRDDRP